MTSPRTDTHKKKVKAKKVSTGKKKKTGTNGARPANDAQPAPAGNRPIIQMITGEHSDVVDMTELMLIQAGVPLYQRGESLVRPIIREVDASHGRRTKVAQLAQLNPTYTRDLMCRHCEWQRFDKRAGDWVRTLAPIAIANTLLARNGDWKVPAIVGCLSCPTLRPDGSLLTAPGYDPATRLLLVAPPEMPTIPDKPTKQDALKALELLEELLSEFPFVDEVAKSVGLSGLITPIARGAFAVAPLHITRAPVAGSGKSYLWDTASMIAIGQLMPVMAAGANEEELEKRLGAALMTAQPLICIDNVVGELGGAALCQAVERSVIEIRILGRSERVRIEARGTTLYGSGNNIVIVGDLCRRTITATLDPRVERPELRTFTKDPIATVLEDRGKYIAAALTIVRAYFVAGRPNLAPKLASFEGWSDCVRSALMWLGKADPIASMEIARDEDPERAELSEMLTAWGDTIGIGSGARVTLAAVISRSEKTSKANNFSAEEPDHPELLAAVTAAAYAMTLKRGQKADAKLLSLWLRNRKGRIVDGKRFANVVKKDGAEWWIEKVDGSQSLNAEEVPPAPPNGKRKTKF
jgi:putative DNA primase/helicase